MAILYGFPFRCFFSSVLLSDIMRSKENYYVQSQLKNFSRIKEQRTDTP